MDFLISSFFSAPKYLLYLLSISPKKGHIDETP